MRKLSFHIFVAILLLPLLGSPALAVGEKYDPIQTALALNYCQMSICRMIAYNDRVVLDQEYDNIINNINLTKIEDREIVDLLGTLMDTLTQYKLEAGDRKWLEKAYEKEVEQAVYGAFSNSAGMLTSAAANLATGRYDRAVGDLSRVGLQYFNYKKLLEQSKDQLEQAKWELEKNVIEWLNYQRKEMLSVSWELLKRYRIPDEWRLTEKQINKYIAILKDDQVKRRLRKLARVKPEFQAYPPFWYYYGKAAQDSSHRDLALECYAKYEKTWKGIFRSDPFYTSTCMNRIALLDPEKDRDEALRNLKIITKQSKDDGNINLFSALTYLSLKEYQKAKQFLRMNIDNEYQISLNERLMGEVHLQTNSGGDLHLLIDRMIKNDDVKNQDILYLVGRARKLDLLKKIEKQISDIELTLDPGFLSKADIVVKLPVKWFFDNLEVTLSFDKQLAKPCSIDPDEHEKVVYCVFKSILDEKDYVEKKESKMFTLGLKHASSPMDVVFVGEIKEENVDSVGGKVAKSKYVPKWMKKKLKESGTADQKQETRIEFALKEIRASDKVYVYRDGVIAEK